MKQSPKLPPQQRRAELIRAASRVFERVGYVEATTENIAREAGVTKGALYFHFRSKEDIFLETLKAETEALFAAIFKHLESPLPPEKVIENVIRTTFELLGKKSNKPIENWHQAFHMPRVREYMSRAHRRIAGRMAAYLKGSSNMSYRQAETLVWVVHAIADGLLVHRCYHREKKRQQKIIDLVVEMCKIYLRTKK